MLHKVYFGLVELCLKVNNLLSRLKKLPIVDIDGLSDLEHCRCLFNLLLFALTRRFLKRSLLAGSGARDLQIVEAFLHGVKKLT
mmetsp:Transcript_12438/g.15890  ORF Transcript_12438/g.15890 Transcript_12438/m.15890 type:complete len:84 (-) Transcript_12438:1395-1646(-)